MDPELAAALVAERAASEPRQLEPLPGSPQGNPFERGGIVGQPTQPQARLELPESLRTEIAADGGSTSGESADTQAAALDIPSDDTTSNIDELRGLLQKVLDLLDRSSAGQSPSASIAAPTPADSSGGKAEAASEAAMPVVFSVRLENIEPLTAAGIRAAMPRAAEMLAEIADEKDRKLLWFLWTEERRLNPDMR